MDIKNKGLRKFSQLCINNHISVFMQKSKDIFCNNYRASHILGFFTSNYITFAQDIEHTGYKCQLIN